MSFLSGIVDFGKSVIGAVSGNSTVSSLVQVAALGFALNQLSSTNKKNEDGDRKPNIDRGVRLQVEPNSENRIPIVYGEAFTGSAITDAELSSDNKTMYYALTISEHTGARLSDGIQSSTNFRDIYWQDQRIVFKSDGVTVDYTVDRQGNVDRNLGGLVKIYCYDGDSESPIAPDGYTPSSLPFAYDIMPSWTTNHMMPDLVFAIVRVDYNREKGVQGIGNVLFHVESDMKLPGDVLYDYMTNGRYGAGIDEQNIDNSLVELNTFSTQSVSYDDEGTGVQNLADRYQINGVIDTGTRVLENIEKVCSAAGSFLSYDVYEGKWSIVINWTASSVASFDDTNVIGSINVSGTGLTELYNRVRVEFPHRELRDSADFYTIEIPAVDRNPNENDNTLNISYDILNEPIQAQLLALIELKQSRIDFVARFQTDYSYLNVRAGDVIDLTDPRFGWSSKKFRVINVEEEQESDGPIILSFTVAEYDENVYSTADLFRYTRTDENGIIGLGTLDAPTTPQVTKFESNANPRVLIETTAPTGIVEGIEFWRTTDVGVTEPNRTYTLIGVSRPQNGGVFTSGSPVDIEYPSTVQGDFLVKARAINTTNTGPFSDPSGLINFNPKQVTDAIDPDTSILDGFGGIATALAAFELLGLLDDLYQGITGNGSLFEEIFKVFEDVTGFDILGNASDGGLTADAVFDILNDGTSETSQVSSIDFTGPINASGDGSGNISVGLQDGGSKNDILAWDGSKWVVVQNCCEVTFPGGGGGGDGEEPTPAVPCTLQIVETCPNTGRTNNCDQSVVTRQGSLYVRYEIDAGSFEGGDPRPERTQYSPLKTGTGTVTLYKTDGTLVEGIAASNLVINNDVVEIPFSDRLPGCDYYVIMDQGVVTNCEGDCESVPIEDSTTWAFTTTIDDNVPPCWIKPTTLAEFNPSYPTEDDLVVTAVTPGWNDGTPQCPPYNLTIQFSEPVAAVSGFVNVKNKDSGAISQAYDVTTASIVGNTVNFGIINVDELSHYEIEVPAGTFTTTRSQQDVGTCGVSITYDPLQDVNKVYTSAFKTTETLKFLRVETCSSEVDSSKTDIYSPITIVFNKAVTKGDITPAEVTIFRSDGEVHQKFDLNHTFENDKVPADIQATPSNTLVLNPTCIFDLGQDYYLNIANNAIKDAACDSNYAGINDTTTARWTTDGIVGGFDVTETKSNQDFVGNPGEETLTIETDRPVQKGYGRMDIFDEDGNYVGSVDATHPAVEVRDLEELQ